MSQMQTMNDVQLKRSWKMPVVYVLAVLLQILFTIKVSGDVTIRLNDKSQSLNIDDIVTPGRPILLVLTALTLVVAMWSIYSVWARRQNPRWLDVTMMIVAGIATVFGFLIYAGSGSSGVVTLTSTLYSTVAISTPLIFGSLSGVVSERVGVVNIAIEGDLLLGAFAGVMAASYFQTSWAGLIAADRGCLPWLPLGALLGQVWRGSDHRRCGLERLGSGSDDFLLRNVDDEEGRTLQYE